MYYLVLLVALFWLEPPSVAERIYEERNIQPGQSAPTNLPWMQKIKD